jgi:DNA-directed RNA polymerase specialized sigma24 family protein
VQTKRTCLTERISARIQHRISTRAIKSTNRGIRSLSQLIIANTLLHPVLPNHDITEFYRLAVLLGGDPASAESLVADTVNDLSRQLGQVRDWRSARPLVASKLRERYLAIEKEPSSQPGAPSPNGQPLELARQFHSLPEPQRSALALFHLDLLKTSDIAGVLNVSLEQLADILAEAREQLKKRVRV